MREMSKVSSKSTICAAYDVFNEAHARLSLYTPGVSVFEVGPLLCTHYDPPVFWETHGFFTFDVDPGEVVAVVRAFKPGPHLIGHLTADTKGIVKEYDELGYKNIEWIEPLMLRPLLSYSCTEPKFDVHRVSSQSELDCYNSVQHSPASAEEAKDPWIWNYYIEVDGKPVCDGKAIRSYSGTAVNIMRLGTHPDYRRRGLATALMERIHSDAFAEGVQRCVLRASEMGAPLYETMGYETLAYVPKFTTKE